VITASKSACQNAYALPASPARRSCILLKNGMACDAIKLPLEHQSAYFHVLSGILVLPDTLIFVRHHCTKPNRMAASNKKTLPLGCTPTTPPHRKWPQMQIWHLLTHTYHESTKHDGAVAAPHAQMDQVCGATVGNNQTCTAADTHLFPLHPPTATPTAPSKATPTKAWAKHLVKS
jgi:hypothetical protein